MRTPFRAPRRTPHIDGVTAAIGDREGDRPLCETEIGAGTVTGDRLVELRIPGRQHEGRDTAHGQSADGVDSVAREGRIDDGRQLPGQERLPLVAPEVRIVAAPIGVIACLAADRHHDVDVPTGEERFGIGGIGPGALLHTGVQTVEQVVGGSRSPTGRMQHLHLNGAAHGRRVDEQCGPGGAHVVLADHRCRRGSWLRSGPGTHDAGHDREHKSSNRRAPHIPTSISPPQVLLKVTHTRVLRRRLRDRRFLSKPTGSR